MTGEPDEFVISSLQGLKALSHPIRSRIIFLLHEPRTVKDLASSLDLDPVKLYYHVNLLLENGLIDIASTVKRGGVEERAYRLSAKKIRIDDGLAEGGGGAPASAQLIARVLRDALTDLRRLEPATQKTRPRAAALRRTLLLPPDEIRTVVAAIDDLLSRHDASGSGTPSACVSVTLAIIPTEENA
jgi:DNA-binding transcriptional ArsR family regulator